jgi:hypothetical protein
MNLTIAEEFSHSMILHDQNIAFPKGTQRQRGFRVDFKSPEAIPIRRVIETLHALIIQSKTARGLSSFTSRRGFLFFGAETQETQNRLLADPENCHLKESLANDVD